MPTARPINCNKNTRLSFDIEFYPSAASAFVIAAMCVGVVPQQPPIKRAPCFASERAFFAKSSGVKS
jgi:hypothetical protein